MEFLEVFPYFRDNGGCLHPGVRKEVGHCLECIHIRMYCNEVRTRNDFTLLIKNISVPHFCTDYSIMTFKYSLKKSFKSFVKTDKNTANQHIGWKLLFSFLLYFIHLLILLSIMIKEMFKDAIMQCHHENLQYIHL